MRLKKIVFSVVPEQTIHLFQELEGILSKDGTVVVHPGSSSDEFVVEMIDDKVERQVRECLRKRGLTKVTLDWMFGNDGS